MKIENINNLPVLLTSRNPKITKQVLIGPADIPNLSGFSKAVFSPGQSDPEHEHPDSYEIIIVEEGKGNLKNEDNNYSLNPGVYVVVEPGEKHEVSNAGVENLVLLCLGIKIQI